MSACNFSLQSSCIGEASRKPAPIIVAMRWPYARRKFFNVAELNKAPIAVEHDVIQIIRPRLTMAAFTGSSPRDGSCN
jgi:hypothetical protein